MAAVSRIALEWQIHGSALASYQQDQVELIERSEDRRKLESRPGRVYAASMAMNLAYALHATRDHDIEADLSACRLEDVQRGKELLSNLDRIDESRLIDDDCAAVDVWTRALGVEEGYLWRRH